MAGYESRAYGDEGDLALLREFAGEVLRARLPGLAYWHPGDVTWGMCGGAEPAHEDVRLWFDGGEVVGLGWFEPPLNVVFDVRPGVARGEEIAGAILDWAGERREAALAGGETEVPRAYAMLEGLTATCLESDTERVALLERRGYRKAERFQYRFSLDLGAAPGAPELPPGARVRHATEADIAERADLHRDAWSVWGESSVREEAYRRLRGAPGYDEELDVVIEVDGRLVSYCICWADPGSGLGLFEPVGTRPEHAGRGFARAVTFDGLRRLRERGLTTAWVGTASVNDRAAMLYQSCGFGAVELEWSWTLE